jgi:hypothetical protein
MTKASTYLITGRLRGCLRLSDDTYVRPIAAEDRTLIGVVSEFRLKVKPSLEKPPVEVCLSAKTEVQHIC